LCSLFQLVHVYGSNSHSMGHEPSLTSYPSYLHRGLYRTPAVVPAGALQLLETEKEAEHYSGRLSTAMSGFRRKFGDFGIRLHNGQGRTYQTQMGEALWKVSQ
jgi:hypothetical protein